MASFHSTTGSPRILNNILTTGVLVGFAALAIGCASSRVAIDLPIHDPIRATKCLSEYGIHVLYDSRTNQIFVDRDMQQSAVMALTHDGQLDTGVEFDRLLSMKAAERDAKSVAQVSGEMVELKIPVTDPAAAVRRLAMYGIKAEHDMAKAAVVVPAELEEKAAMILTFTGMLPNGREAYGFLNENNLAMTDAQYRMRYVVRLQDMLADVIAASPDISQAEVFLTEHAKPWEFRSTDKTLDAKASVKVETSHGGRLTEEQQLAIASLVAGSFQALDESNVRISDFALNFYPTIDANWVTNFTIQSRQSSIQRSAERKIELVLAEYNPTAAATIPMKAIERKVVNSDVPGARYASGTSGQEGIASRDAAFDPGRTLQSTERLSQVKSVIVNYEPNYAEASASIHINTKELLSDQRLAELKQAAAGATGISADRINILVTITKE